MNIIDSQKTLLAYDFSVSAKKTGKALAVIETSEGQKRVKQLTCIDLNAQSIWAKIVLWWNNSLKLSTINAFVNELPMPEVLLQRANIEKQINRIQQKILRSNHCSEYFKKTIRNSSKAQWRSEYHMVSHYPTKRFADGDRELTTEKCGSIIYNRLTTKQDIYQHLEKALSGFADCKYEGNYDGKNDTTSYLNDNEIGAHKSFLVTLSNYQGEPLSDSCYIPKTTVRLRGNK